MSDSVPVPDDDARAERQDRLGDCLRASFSIGDDESPESRDLLIRMFALKAPRKAA